MKGNKIEIDGDVAYVTLNKKHVAVIDAADVDKISPYTWFANVTKRKDGTIRTVYAVAANSLSMHRLLLDAPSDSPVDHVSGVGIDNRRANIRLVTPRLNSYNRGIQSTNTSGFKGVHWNRMTHKFHAVIHLDKKPWIVGKFKTAEEAARRYDHAARRFYGKFACLNFPNKGEQSAHRKTA
jgi:hypothetical protein